MSDMPEWSVEFWFKEGVFDAFSDETLDYFAENASHKHQANGTGFRGEKPSIMLDVEAKTPLKAIKLAYNGLEARVAASCPAGAWTAGDWVTGIDVMASEGRTVQEMSLREDPDYSPFQHSETRRGRR